MPNLIPSKRFSKTMNALSATEQIRVNRALMRMQENPRHSSLRTKKIKALDDIFESRASDSIRIIWQWYDGQILLLLVGGHEIVEY
jgi:mRNA-degrading endonuclease RelE of RelBE toxin-antitoxin system